MLWTDAIFVTESDLARIDSEVSPLARANGVTLSGSNGLIRGGIEEAANEIQKRIIAFGGYLNSGDLTANHLAAVLNVGIGNSVRQKALLSQVCVSGNVDGEITWIKQYVVYWILQCFYQDIYGRTVTDRFEKKMRFYSDKIARTLQANLYGLGVPVVLQPLQAPAAFWEPGTGSWGAANVTETPGAGTSTTAIDVVVTYVDQSSLSLYQSAANPQNSESNPSQIATFVPTAGNVTSVSISTLNPPSGGQNPATVLICVMSPLKATGWNVYMGPNGGGALYLQNPSPIPIATKTFTLSGDPTFSGYTSGIGQYQNRRLSLIPMRQRA